MCLFTKFFCKKKQTLKIYAPVSGKIIKIEEVEDPVFSQKILGDGFAILPKEGTAVMFTAPCAGKLVTVFDTGHAYGILDKKTKIEVLVHIGMDTVELKGKLFDVKVKQNEVVATNQPLTIANLKAIKRENKQIITPIIFTNETMKNYKITILKELTVEQGELVAEISKK